MKKLLILLFIGVLSISFSDYIFGKGDNKRSSTQKEYFPGKFIVKLKSPQGLGKVNSDKLAGIKSRFNVYKQEEVFAKAKNLEVKKKLNLDNVFLLHTDLTSNIDYIVNELSKDPSVEYAEPVYLNRIDAEPNDSLYSVLHHLPQVLAPEAWDIASGSADVVIGVIDTGVDWDHEDLVDIIWTNDDEIPDNGIDDDNNGYIDDTRGWDFVYGVDGEEPYHAHPDEDGDVADNDPMDFNGHGTHVAGLAAGHTNNSVGIASVAAGARIMPLKAGYHRRDGNGSVPFPVDAYIYAADNGADITNQSSQNSGQAIIDAAYYAFQNGVLVFESAGNGDAITPSALGGQPWVISVGAVNRGDQKTYYSSYGDYVKVSAPGGEQSSQNDPNGLLSTVPYPSTLYQGENYYNFQGTSMAAPLAASVAGLVKSHYPELTPLELFTRVVETADNIDAKNPDYAGLLGTGRVNTLRALTEFPEPEVDIAVTSFSIDDSGGDNDGLLDAGEQATLNLVITNKWADASGVAVDVTLMDSRFVSISNTSFSVGSMAGVTDNSNWEETLPVTVQVSADALPQSFTIRVDITADGFSSSTYHNIPITPQVLLISDFDQKDNNFFDYSSYFIDAFNANGTSFEHLHRVDIEDMSAELLSKYRMVVWGCEWSFPSLDSLDRVALTEYLNNGGALFLSGQDIGWDLYDASVDGDSDIQFYENLLKNQWVNDDAGVDVIHGVEGDPITGEFEEFSFFQPRRPPDNQYPDVLVPLESAVSMLNYPNGSSGAVRYSGNYRTVNFGFGGFESVTDSLVRTKLMSNVLRWLSGIDTEIDKYTDTETTNEDFVVNCNVSSGLRDLASITLYWDDDAEGAYNTIEMTNVSGDQYQAVIPAPNGDAEITYFVYVTSSDGTYSFSEEVSFTVGTDNEAPTVESLSTEIANSVNVFGPTREFMFSAEDNIGIDTTSGMVEYWVNEQPAESNLFEYIGDNTFSGQFQFDSPLTTGDSVYYRFAVRDESSSQNEGYSDTYSYMIDTVALIDGFEDGLDNWMLEDTWGISIRKKSGEFSLTDSPNGMYQDNLNSSSTYKYSFNLSTYRQAWIELFLRSHMQTTFDSLYVDVSADDGQTWSPVWGYSKSSTLFRQQIASLNDYTGPGNENVHFRFRLHTDSTSTRDGVWIDDVSIYVSYDSLLTSTDNEIASLPKEYSIGQNYPNPFNPSTTLSYSLPASSRVSVKVFNTLGQEIAVLVNSVVSAGRHEINWNASGYASGIYLYRIDAEAVDGSRKFNSTKKMILLK